MKTTYLTMLYFTYLFTTAVTHNTANDSNKTKMFQAIKWLDWHYNRKLRDLGA